MHQSSISNPSPVLHTCSVSFVSVTAFPSMSVGDMVTAPLAVASSETSSCPSPISTSGTSLASTLFLLEEREEEDPVILETATLGDWLGDSFSLKEDHQLPVSELCNTPRHRRVFCHHVGTIKLQLWNWLSFSYHMVCKNTKCKLLI